MTVKKRSADDEEPLTKAALIDKHVTRALEKVDGLLEGNQHMAGGEGPLHTHPGAFGADSTNEDRAGFLRAVLEPVLRTALTSFSRELAKEKLEAEPAGPDSADETA